MGNKKILLWFFFGFGLFGNLYAQSKELKVLFLGNSYTYVNNLPKLLTDMAFSTGDTLFTDENTPGGYRLMGHASNATSIAKIKSAQWDYVVLQDQSQLPSFPEADVQVMVYPFARALDSMIQENYACSKTVFYMTWGRKNGDAQNCAFWPPVCTYQGMDSLLALRYRKMANDNKALLSPVGALWRYLRTNHPTIELYQSDESHPSLAGTYAAACSFYAVILRKDPTLITYDGGLPAAEALAIRAAAKWVVYQNLGDLNMGLFEPKAHFKHVISGLNSRLVQFENQSTNADSYVWHFGDGDTSTQVNPQHIYQAAGTYKARLLAMRCGISTSRDTEIVINNTTGIFNSWSEPIRIFPNPSEGVLYFEVPARFVGLYYQVIDVFGKVILRERVGSEKGQISLEGLAAGMYGFQLGNYHQKVVKR